MASKKHAEQEAIAAQYAQSIYESVEGINPTQIKYGQKSKLEGISGQKHQIDVSVWGSNDLILIECKHREKKSIGVEMALTFFGRLYDIRQYFLHKEKIYTIHGVMVASKPFDSGAKIVAQYYGIDLQSSNSVQYFALKYKDLVAVHPAPLMIKWKANPVRITQA
jgi:hypothetical protein